MPSILQLLVVFLTCALVLGLLLARARHMPMDHPNERSLHTRPVPRVGGIGVMLALLAGAMLDWRPETLPLWLSAFVLALFSALDDARGLSVRVRLPVQALVVAAFLAWQGATPGWAGAAALLAILWMTNLYNFMDGADGLAGGMAAIGFAALGVAAAQAGAAGLAGLCLSVTAAALAFLVFNFPPARLFMGDAGSIPLGFLAGGSGWLGWRQGIWPWAFPLLVFSPFIVDATVTLAQRALRGERVWQAHRSHYYQRLVRMGWSHRRLAVAAYVVMLAAALTAWAALKIHGGLWPVLGLWLLLYGLAGAWVDRRWRRGAHAI
jgi:UDP-GlcNAc:undecaprenyl-phosphate/decaprenyl-phosphate GlcNAc-1-phosphate transferase